VLLKSLLIGRGVVGYDDRQRAGRELRPACVSFGKLTQEYEPTAAAKREILSAHGCYLAEATRNRVMVGHGSIEQVNVLTRVQLNIGSVSTDGHRDDVSGPYRNPFPLEDDRVLILLLQLYGPGGPVLTKKALVEYRAWVGTEGRADEAAGSFLRGDGVEAPFTLLPVDARIEFQGRWERLIQRLQ
jgi:hypothetical protein